MFSVITARGSIDTYNNTTLSGEKPVLEPTTTALIHRKIKFLPNTASVPYSIFFRVTHKNDQLPEILKHPT